MYKKVTESAFVRTFQELRPENFSIPALRVLFDHLEAWENDTGKPMELDPIAICCDWAEYTEAELLREYGDASDDPYDDGDAVERVIENIQDEGGDVLEVGHAEGEDTYLVRTC